MPVSDCDKPLASNSTGNISTPHRCVSDNTKAMVVSAYNRVLPGNAYGDISVSDMTATTLGHANAVECIYAPHSTDTTLTLHVAEHCVPTSKP